MIKSMTGYGRGDVSDQDTQVICELRAVNHRFAEVVTRLPREYVQYEESMKRAILSGISRGRIDAYLTVIRGEAGRTEVRLNVTLAEELKRAADRLADELRIVGALTVANLLSFPQIITIEETAEDPQLLKNLILSSVQVAVDDLVWMRSREGERLAVDFQERLQKLAGIVSEMEQRSPEVVKDHRDRLINRIKDVLDGSPEVDESKLLVEVALIADRMNIDEEIVRLKSHTEQFQELLNAVEPIGRKLDFLVQEMNREVNTIGAKANDLFLSQKVVDAKSLLEQIREQVQNVE